VAFGGRIPARATEFAGIHERTTTSEQRTINKTRVASSLGCLAALSTKHFAIRSKVQLMTLYVVLVPEPQTQLTPPEHRHHPPSCLPVPRFLGVAPMGFFLPTETGRSFDWWPTFPPCFLFGFKPLVVISPKRWSTDFVYCASCRNGRSIFAFSHGSAQVRSLTWYQNTTVASSTPPPTVTTFQSNPTRVFSNASFSVHFQRADKFDKEWSESLKGNTNVCSDL
jgi:hypothetical protein